VLAGLLSDITRVDVASLEQGLQQFLRDFDAVGGQVAGQAAEVGVASWLTPTIAATILAVEFARRKLRRTPLQFVVRGAADTTWNWCSGVGEPDLEDRS